MNMRKIRRILLTRKRLTIKWFIKILCNMTGSLRKIDIKTYQKINATFTAEERLAKWEKNKEAIMKLAPSAAALIGTEGYYERED